MHPRHGGRQPSTYIEMHACRASLEHVVEDGAVLVDVVALERVLELADVVGRHLQHTQAPPHATCGPHTTPHCAVMVHPVGGGGGVDGAWQWCSALLQAAAAVFRAGGSMPKQDRVCTRAQSLGALQVPRVHVHVMMAACAKNTVPGPRPSHMLTCMATKTTRNITLPSLLHYECASVAPIIGHL